MSVEKIEYYFTRLTSKEIPEIERCFNGLPVIPLAPSRVNVYLDNCDISIVNGLRRVLLNEMQGHALHMPVEGFIHSEESDPFMLYNFIGPRISYIRLIPNISDEIKETYELELHVKNETPNLLSVYSGDFKVVGDKKYKLLFNPTYKIAELQPGKCINIKGIKIASGTGMDHAKFNVVCNASHKHLDIPEAEVKEILKGDVMSQSGYLVSSQLSTPRKHKLMFNIPTTNGTAEEIKYVLTHAIENIRTRLSRIKASITINQKRGTVDYTVTKTGDLYQANLRITQETVTVGHLIRYFIYETDKTVCNLSVKTGKHAEDVTVILGHTTEPEVLIKKAITTCITTLEKISADIMKAPVTNYPMEKYVDEFNSGPKV